MGNLMLNSLEQVMNIQRVGFYEHVVNVLLKNNDDKRLPYYLAVLMFCQEEVTNFKPRYSEHFR